MDSFGVTGTSWDGDCNRVIWPLMFWWLRWLRGPHGRVARVPTLLIDAVSCIISIRHKCIISYLDIDLRRPLAGSSDATERSEKKIAPSDMIVDLLRWIRWRGRRQMLMDALWIHINTIDIVLYVVLTPALLLCDCNYAFWIPSLTYPLIMLFVCNTELLV